MSRDVEASPSGRDAADLCGEYLLLDGQLASLVDEWQTLENRAIEREGWFDLSEEARQRVPEAREMAALDARLDELSARRNALLDAIVAAAAPDMRNVAAKLAVALRTIQPEDGLQTHALLASVLRDLSLARCPACEASLTAPAPEA
jgi:citrate synthase